MTEFTPEYVLSRRVLEPIESGVDKNGAPIAVGDTVIFEPVYLGRIRDVVPGCTVKSIFPNGRVTIEHPSFLNASGNNPTKTTSNKHIRKS